MVRLRFVHFGCNQSFWSCRLLQTISGANWAWCPGDSSSTAIKYVC